jgi:hypothetical protein
VGIRAEGLQRATELPRLLALPQDVVPVAMDFVPPVPLVENSAPAPAPPRNSAAQTNPAPRRFEAEPQPHGFHAAQNPNARITRLPQVSPIYEGILEGNVQRDSSFIPAPQLGPPLTAATPLVDERPAPPAVHVEKWIPEKVQQPSSPLSAVNERGSALVTHAAMLADRGALFTARAEFIQALRMITQALDA